MECQDDLGVGTSTYALHCLGRLAHSNVRHPGPNPNDETHEEFHRLVEAVGLSSI